MSKRKKEKSASWLDYFVIVLILALIFLVGMFSMALITIFSEACITESEVFEASFFLVRSESSSAPNKIVNGDNNLISKDFNYSGIFGSNALMVDSISKQEICFSYDGMVQIFDSISENTLKEKYKDCLEENEDSNSVFKINCEIYLNKPSICIVDSNQQQHCYKIIKELEGVEQK